MATTTLLLIRHGETDWNRDGRWQGQTGPGLNDVGRRQAAALAKRLGGSHAAGLASSDLPRAMETAAVLGESLGLEPEPEPGLREVDVGSWAGMTRHEVSQADPDGFERWTHGQAGWEGGETYDEMHRRAIATLRRLEQRFAGRTLLVVTHGGIVRAAAAHAAGHERHDRRRFLGVDNCSLTVVETGIDGGLALNAYNDTGHLAPAP